MFDVDLKGLMELEGGKPPHRLAFEPIARIGTIAETCERFTTTKIGGRFSCSLAKIGFSTMA